MGHEKLKKEKKRKMGLVTEIITLNSVISSGP